jgi:hypothetical protein
MVKKYPIGYAIHYSEWGLSLKIVNRVRYEVDTYRVKELILNAAKKPIKDIDDVVYYAIRGIAHSQRGSKNWEGIKIEK